MCWSGEASAALATVGLVTTFSCYHKKMPPALWVTLGYFSLMELLQAFTYRVINSCSMESNQILTLLGYLHISFQPFFVNLLSMHFLPKERRKKIAVPAYAVCVVASSVMVAQLLPISWAGICLPGEPMCADTLCSVSGNWHIAWNVPLNGLGIRIGSVHIAAYLVAYFVAAFLMPLLYGVWRGTVFHLLLGPVLARLTTSNMNEWPAVWCLLSIGIIMLVIKVRCDPALGHLFVKTSGKKP